MRILNFLLIAVLVVGLGLPNASANTLTATLPKAERQVAVAPSSTPSPTDLIASTPSSASALSTEVLEPLVLEIIRRNPKVILDSVSQYQAATVRDRQMDAWKENLKNPIKVDLSHTAIQGRANSALTLVEFADFQCPYCIQAHPTVKALLSKYKNQIRYAFLHLPLPNHPQALPAAQAAWAATQQGKFFEYQDQLFKLQGNLEAATYSTIAKELGLDIEKFDRDRNSPEASAAINADIQQAEAIGVNGTPTFVLNGVMIRGLPPMEDFESVIALVKKGKT